MRQLLVAVSVSALLVGLTGCAGDGGTAEDPAGSDSHGPMPTAPVAANGGGRAGPGLEPPPVPADRLPAQDLERIADEVRRLGGATGAYAGDTQVLVDVPYDDGSLQDWVDAEYGAGVVAVTPALVDA
jgi:hypothetical protein